MFLFFDTETTGLPLDWKAPVSKVSNWPRLVQLAWIFVDDNGPVQKNSYVIKPEGFRISLDAVKIHGISNELALSSGHDIKEVLINFKRTLNKTEYIIAHNLEFDEKVLGAEYLRQGISNELSLKKRICTMKASTDFCAIPSNRGYKWPTLSELHFKLFKKNYEEKHNAEKDIEATVNCFIELLKLRVINVPNFYNNKKTIYMDIKEQAIFLKGFLESMTYSETISEGQIEMLKNKLSELINTITEEDGGYEDEEEYTPPSNSGKSPNSSSSDITEPIDDLPF